jgi:hypothetical protein
VGGIVASEASRKNFDIPNNIIKRLIGKKITFVTFGGGMAPLAPLDPPLATYGEEREQSAEIEASVSGNGAMSRKYSAINVLKTCANFIQIDHALDQYTSCICVHDYS